VKGTEHTIKVKGLGGSFGYNLQEIRASAKAGNALEQKKANASRQSYEQKVNRLAWFGDSASGLLGMLNQPDVPATTVQVGATSGFFLWSQKTNDEILKDMNDAIGDVWTLTNMVEMPDTLLLPAEQYRLVKTTRLSVASDTTILEFFLANNEGVKVEAVNELSAVAPLPSGGAGPANVMIAYKRDPDKLTLELPQLFEMLAVQVRGLEYVVPTHARYAGVQFYYPLSANIVEGI
jgi:hypothetical protein